LRVAGLDTFISKHFITGSRQACEAPFESVSPFILSGEFSVFGNVGLGQGRKKLALLPRFIRSRCVNAAARRFDDNHFASILANLLAHGTFSDCVTPKEWQQCPTLARYQLRLTAAKRCLIVLTPVDERTALFAAETR
jgi:hypothetical protein